MNSANARQIKAAAAPPGRAQRNARFRPNASYEANSSFSALSRNLTSSGSAGEMAPNRGYGQKFRVRHVGYLELTVLRREVEVGLAGHHIGFGLDGSQCLLEIAVIELVVADVAVLPTSQVSAALTPSRNTKLWREHLAEPQNGAMRSTMSG
jgi:hypothetical protein